MSKKDYTPFREAVGEFLNQRREELGMTMYQFKKKSGLSHGQANAVFKGDKSYTIDSLFATIEALDSYFYFATRDNKTDKLDENDFFKKMDAADPEQILSSASLTERSRSERSRSERSRSEPKDPK